MPHTSRNKPFPSRASNKLVNVPSDHGWATVKRKSRIGQTPRPALVSGAVGASSDTVSLGPHPGASTAYLLEKLTYDQMEYLRRVLPSFRAPEVRSRTPDYTAEEVEVGCKDKAARWAASPEGKAIRKILCERVGKDKLSRIRNATILGSGDLSVIETHTAGQWQVGAFLEMAKMIGELGGQTQPLVLYAQELAYNDVDKTALGAMGIKAFDVPRAVEFMGRDAFAFAPHVQLTAWSQEMRMGRTPLILANDIDGQFETLMENREYFKDVYNPTDSDEEGIPDTNMRVEFETLSESHQHAKYPEESSIAWRAFQGLTFYWSNNAEDSHSEDPPSTTIEEPSIKEQANGHGLTDPDD